jgi:hypothetical protein
LWDSSVGLDWGERHRQLGRGLQQWARQYSLPANKLKTLESQILKIQTEHPATRDHTKELQLRDEYDGNTGTIINMVASKIEDEMDMFRGPQYKVLSYRNYPEMEEKPNFVLIKGR